MTTEQQRRIEKQRKAAEARKREREQRQRDQAERRKAAAKANYVRRGGDEAAFEDHWNRQQAEAARADINAAEVAVHREVQRNF